MRKHNSLSCEICSILFPAVICLGTLTPAAYGQHFPARPVRLIVPVAPGGASDTLARIIGGKLMEKWGYSVVIDNRAGAGTLIGTEIVARAAPDGYTLLLVSIAHASNASLVKKLPYDPVKDFSGVSIVATAPLILVTQPSVAAESVKDLIALAKASPGKLNYASAGNGTGGHLAAELFKTMASVDLVHIPYKSGGQSVAALLAGQVQLSFPTIPPALPHVKAGKLRALGVTSTKRSVAVPEIPTLAEAAVPGYDGNTWNGIVAPAKTPPAVLKRLAQDIASVLNMQDVKEKLLTQGLEPQSNSPEDFDRYIRAEIVKWQKVVKVSGARVD